MDVEVTSNTLPFRERRARMVLAYDITERKGAEEELRASEERYRTILENIEDCYYELDLAGSLTAFNDSLCRALGRTRDEMLGLNYRQYMDQDNCQRIYPLFNSVYRTGEPAKFLE